MHDRTRWRFLLAASWISLAAAPALAQTAETPQRIGPEWGWQKHQPNPAEIEARARARGEAARLGRTDSSEVDRLYRDLIGQDPNAGRPVDSRAADRR